MMKEGPNPATMRRLLSYSPASGVFVWVENPPVGPRVKGRIAGNRDTKGYVAMRVDGRTYKAHRLAWLYMTGEWPAKMLDHKDGDPSNNRWGNLRLASDAQNAANRKRKVDNKSGLKGVYWNKEQRKWASSASANGRRRFLGYFDCPAAAYFAYCVEANRCQGEFARAA